MVAWNLRSHRLHWEGPLGPNCHVILCLFCLFGLPSQCESESPPDCLLIEEAPGVKATRQTICFQCCKLFQARGWDQGQVDPKWEKERDSSKILGYILLAQDHVKATRITWCPGIEDQFTWYISTYFTRLAQCIYECIPRLSTLLQLSIAAAIFGRSLLITYALYICF